MTPDQRLIGDLLVTWFGRPAEADWGKVRDIWFQPTEEFDRHLRTDFAGATQQAARGELDHLTATPEGALAVVLLLDQLPRNLYRDDARAFASDARALAMANQALEAGFDQRVEPLQRWFFYLPLEHAENMADQDRCVALFQDLGSDHQQGLGYALRHRQVIQRFGRFPHRNAVLGRASTPEEKAFLQDQGMGF